VMWNKVFVYCIFCYGEPSVYVTNMMRGASHSPLLDILA